ncbi:MAG TPA: hypothetical protein VJN96_08930 [Vicinamibacterales bacterium]|nr:hypothetical protein [Vicinamibacterales bacterium]
MTDHFLGTWKLNVARSEFDQHHRPSEGTMVISIGEHGEYLMTARGINAKGEAVTERPNRFIPDGQAHPLPDLPGLSTVTTQPDANTLHSEARREDGSVVGGGTFVVSPDGRWMTATNFGYDAQLRQFQQRTVWDRV